MKKSISLDDKIRFILVNYWDPININTNSNLYDEYDSYIGSLKKMIFNNDSLKDFYLFLKNIEIDELGYEIIDETNLINASMKLKDLCEE